MSSSQLTCQFRVEKPSSSKSGALQPAGSAIVDLKDCSDVAPEIRKKWADEIVKHFETSHDSARPWDFLGKLDGSVILLQSSALLGYDYPVWFRIPPETISGLDDQEKVERTEMFAMASLLYEVFTGKKPFEELSDEEVQRRFRIAEFPKDAASLRDSFVIYSGWSKEFADELDRPAPRPSLLQKIGKYAAAHPISTGIHVAGLTLCAGSMAVPGLLSLAGFTAVGPAAGSLAAGWQSSIGAVQAGSLFAWCQGAGMGGAAVGSIHAAWLAGATMAGVPGVLETFQRVYRRGEE